jgi:NADPH:quinone reductase-like Zn-dependent oxidoreductase
VLDFQIRKDDIRVARLAEVDPPPLAEGAARLRLDLFGLTANNVTYAAMGTGPLGYWDFFPGPDGWGRLPVWGFGTVVESHAPGVQVGERFYGYCPASEFLDVLAARVSPRGFMDGAPHRRAKAAVYNLYLNTATDPAYDAQFEPEQVIWRPLYATGWWAADCVARGEPRPKTVVVSSASSKTALATVHRLRELGGIRLVGLTSERNLAYVRETGLYEAVLRYEDMQTLEVEAPAVYLDFLGREALTASVHRLLGKDLVRSILVGATDWVSKPGGVVLPEGEIEGLRPEFFFVPEYAALRLQNEPALGAAMVRDLRKFYEASRTLVRASRPVSGNAIVTAWSRFIAGTIGPDEGVVLTPGR